MYSHTVLDRIYVFDGDAIKTGQLEAELKDAQLSLPHTDGGYYDGGTDPIVNSPLDGKKDAWRYLVRYHYLEDGQPAAPLASHWMDHFVPLLIRTSVTSRPEQTTGSDDSTRSTVFIYGDQTAQIDDAEIPWLSLVYTDEDIRRVLEDADALGLSDLTIRDLAHWQDHSGESLGLDIHDRPELRSHASVELAPLETDEWEQGDNKYMPKALDMVEWDAGHGQYFTRVKERLVGDLKNEVVGIASIRDESGVKRFHRIFRVCHAPEAALNGSTPTDPFWPEPAYGHERHPMRSVFAHPYLWQGYTPQLDLQGGPGDETLAGAVELKDPRWISVVDEFSNRDAMLSRNGTEYAAAVYQGPSGVKKYEVATDVWKGCQLSRRIVEISPTGYVLKERRWEYNEDGISVYGGGLGEEFMYEKVDDYTFPVGGLPAPPTITPDPDPDPFHPVHPEQLDPFKSVREELLLVERRSVGWSAADLQDRDPANPDPLARIIHDRTGSAAPLAGLCCYTSSERTTNGQGEHAHGRAPR